jgi:predicted dehydrogenase
MPMHRRTFFLGSLTAAASTRVMGANSRLGIAIVGPGAMGMGHLRTFAREAPALNAEMRVVCDLWNRRREAAAASVKQASGREPRQLQHLADVLAMKEVDGVLLATPDHQHARQLIQSVKAGKDVFCEKPMGNVLAEVKEAYRVVTTSKQVVQLGTHRLSNGSCQAAAAFVRSGKLGKISRVDHQGSVNSPRWSPIPAVKEIRERDTDWKAWLMGRRPRPFDARLYFEYRLFREFSNGIPDQWLTHAATAVHHIMDDYFPVSVVASGGVLVYPDGRESSDTFAATLLYPKGFLFTYAAMFGNNYPGHVRYFGQNGTIERVGGDDDGTYVVKGLGGGDRPERIKQDIPLPAISPAPTNHLKNWLTCMRTRATPIADVRSGYAHSVVSIMAARSEWTGKKLYWDARREEIVDRPVA